MWSASGIVVRIQFAASVAMLKNLIWLTNRIILVNAPNYISNQKPKDPSGQKSNQVIYVL
jgi:hypothetical protein